MPATSPPITAAVASAFRAIRLHRNLTQEDFVPASGRTYVSELERGRKNVTVAKLHELAATLGVHPLTVLVQSYMTLEGENDLDKLLGRLKVEITSLEK